ncbi:hypothetical protein E2C01_030541 [Portunus trituberculatus]|uniref:Uncharacterized protein n=1 Tax=Portunus trituberculatus TaxID=210409 RepID=A0A5B7EVI4_PORTR|nr:hypothetical protein [Portunus trituberculatus]
MSDVTKWRENMPGSTDRQKRPKVRRYRLKMSPFRTYSALLKIFRTSYLRTSFGGPQEQCHTDK